MNKTTIINIKSHLPVKFESHQDFLSFLVAQLEKLQEKLDNSRGKYIVASENLVFVGVGQGLNQTGFMVKSLFTDNVVVFDDKETAYRYINPYLIDMNGKPICNIPVKAYDFYRETMESCLDTIKFVIESYK